MENSSPMIQQYLRLKNQLDAEVLLFYRLGDFYELFFEDAHIVSKELDLILTSRSAGNNKKAAMCGVPYHAADSYMQKLVDKGFKIAIAEQMEDPASTKGLVKRDIVKIVTQGMNMEVEEKQSVLLASVDSDLVNYHIAYLDLASNIMSTQSVEKDIQTLLYTLYSQNVKEIVTSDRDLLKRLKEKTDLVLSYYQLDQAQASLDPLKNAQTRLLTYGQYTQKQPINPRYQHQEEKIMELDYNTVLNLELLNTLRNQTKTNSLWSYLDKTQSSMGSRKLKEWIQKPLYDLKAILNRQNKIEYLMKDFILQHELGIHLKEIYDIERIATRISYKNVHAQDLVRLKDSLIISDKIKKLLKSDEFRECESLPSTLHISQLLDKTITDNPPTLIKDGNTIKEKVDKELDEYRSLLKDSQQWLLNYEASERERTKIKNLKVGYSRAFGYYIEVSKGQVNLVKEEFGYIPRQTLTSAQRYLSAELKNMEDKILSAHDKVLAIETRIFDELIDKLQKETEKLAIVATKIAEIDVLYAFSIISNQSGFTKPIFHPEKSIKIIESKHPILELALKNHQVIANDCVLDENSDIMILTGPNMGGKSTYMRQIAIVIIMAQMGCYVKAQQAKLPLFDRLFTRMGATDDIMLGQSTFMIEMSEANVAISHATENSLILFDEIGRGTATYDGMAIARSIIEYIATKIKAKTIFSTHYHELTNLEDEFENIKNFQVMVKEEKKEITFLYKIKPGPAQSSYGVHVASLAQLPDSIIKSARFYLSELENSSTNMVSKTFNDIETEIEPSKAEKLLAEIDLENTTPLEALNILTQLQKLVKDSHE